MTALVSIENLSVALPPGGDRKFALQNVSLELEAGEITCIVGESGSGKSVLASAIMGALPRGLRRTEGRILFRGEDLTAMPEQRLRGLRGSEMAMVFQEPVAALNPAIPVGRQIDEVFRIHTPAISEAGRRARVLNLLADTHLPDPATIARRYPHELSGGQCQRVVIAMALAMRPALLIADEPTTALDVVTQAQILTLLRELRDRMAGRAVLLVTHDFGVVADIADRVAVMQGGQVVECGPVRQILHAPAHDYTRALIRAVPGLAPRPARPVDYTAGQTAGLSIEALKVAYGPVRAVDGVSLRIPKGGTLAVVGESGSGKTTVARAVIRLVGVTAGRIVVGGENLAALSGQALRRRRRLVQMIFQDPYGSLNPRRTVGAILTRAGRLGGLDRQAARDRAAALIERVGLSREALARRPMAFSGGQRQRIGIARALAMNPQVVIADESVSALDASVQAQVLALLAELQMQQGLTLLFITHDLRVAASIADVIAVMRAGLVVECRPAAELLTDPYDPYTQQLLAAAPGRASFPAHQPDPVP